MSEKIFTLKPALYIVPTPIGNIDDITVRGLKTLRAADIVFCEDTRVTGKLLKIYGIVPQRLASAHEHNEARQSELVAAEIKAGKSVVLASDAGSPLISDPGARIVAAAISAGVEIVPLPGATAFVPALSASGFDCSEFTFFGFPPYKKGRASFLKRVSETATVSILYESPHRLTVLLNELTSLCEPSRKCCAARELTKLHEEILRGTLAELAAHFTRTEPRGEFVVILDGAQRDE
ncbi:16S rRNA (cytidine(1402)-2'-O)-methyltransferase [Ignavibacteria bacterium]|nr:16S rRNA (cytidine(1402)-2'-O)-methyltransferase [Bacteroidota bacterium]MCZ2133317.1 16S rRNA (cytidine(1402)-2'-O)-methyltransferase [Bacteroidota bacterium]